MLQGTSSTLVAENTAAQSSVDGVLSRAPENPDGTDATEMVRWVMKFVTCELAISYTQSQYIEVAQGHNLPDKVDA